ncbi:MAG: dihydroorotase [Pontimonas sp.]
MTSYLIQGASLLGAKAADLGVLGGAFVDASEVAGLKKTRVIDATGLVALPGLVDLHTHVRQPGGEQAETVRSGSRAAALGGYTAVHAMANTSPVSDTAELVSAVARWGAEAGYVEVRPVGAVTKGLEGQELAPLGAMARSAAQVRVFSDDGKCVHDSSLMRRALQQARSLDAVIAQHAQDPGLTEGAQMNDGPLAAALGLAGWPAVAEESIIARDVLLAESVGARLHVCHVSTAGSIEVIRWAKARGISVTAEVTPHHLLLTEELVSTFDPLFKVNPPLRRQEDVLALREAVASGVIDIVATDHAPHPSEVKDCSFPEGAFGMLGLETALPVVLSTLVNPGMVSLKDVARFMSTTPAAIGRLEGYSSPFALGEPAHITLVDPTAEASEPRGSLSHNNPYRGRDLEGRVVHTMYRGNLTVTDGELVERPEVNA